jgi:hypothetical protein
MIFRTLRLPEVTVDAIDEAIYCGLIWAKEVLSLKRLPRGCSLLPYHTWSAALTQNLSQEAFRFAVDEVDSEMALTPQDTYFHSRVETNMNQNSC